MAVDHSRFQRLLEEMGIRPDDQVPARLDGHVGELPASLGARDLGDSVLRVDCYNNPEFWLEYNRVTGQVRGRVPTALYTRDEMQQRGFLQPFVARVAADGTIFIKHQGCEAFWLEITLL